MRRIAAVLVVLGLLVACGGDDDADDPKVAGAKACADFKAIGNLNADTLADAQAIADRDGVPEDLRAAMEDLIGVLGGDQTQAGQAQQTMLQLRDLCDGYEAD